jgi:hypothetical protein
VDHWDILVFVEILWICQVYKIALRDAVSILFVETKILYSGLNLIILRRPTLLAMFFISVTDIR